MRVYIGIASAQPVEVFAHVEQVPIHLDEHLASHLMGELRL